MLNLALIDNLKQIDVTVVCVTKHATIDQMNELLVNGMNIFGENYVQSFLEKYDMLIDKKINWHFIGHLQTNKVKKMINKIDCLHSLDSLNLAKSINKYRVLPLDCFVEININDENSKTGISLENLTLFLDELKQFKMINPIGLMVMGVNDDLIKTEEGFKKAFKTVEQLSKSGYNITKLSMGMSDDYALALKHNTTHIRLGRSLFSNL